MLINNSDDVTVQGFHARNYKANCFFATNLQDYVLDRLVAERCGVYGVYAFNSKGGRMTNSEAYYNPDSGFYVGQTPPQKGRKKRTLVKNVTSWGNVLGFSGTNMRYTTITKSRWYNNGTGIVPNTLDSEKYYPPTENVIADNDVFWNNWNFYWGAPFKIPGLSAADIPYPIGVGILLFGSQKTVVERNRISGNYLTGFVEVPAVQLTGNSDPKKNEAVDPARQHRAPERLRGRRRPERSRHGLRRQRQRELLRGQHAPEPEPARRQRDLRGLSGHECRGSERAGPGAHAGSRRRRRPGLVREELDQAPASAAQGTEAPGALRRLASSGTGPVTGPSPPVSRKDRT